MATVWHARQAANHAALFPAILPAPFPANRLPPFTRQSIWEIFQVVKRISGTFGWLCHDEPQSEWAWSQPSLIPPLSYRPLEPLHMPVIVYRRWHIRSVRRSQLKF